MRRVTGPQDTRLAFRIGTLPPGSAQPGMGSVQASPSSSRFVFGEAHVEGFAVPASRKSQFAGKSSRRDRRWPSRESTCRGIAAQLLRLAAVPADRLQASSEVWPAAHERRHARLRRGSEPSGARTRRSSRTPEAASSRPGREGGRDMLPAHAAPLEAGCSRPQPATPRPSSMSRAACGSRRCRRLSSGATRARSRPGRAQRRPRWNDWRARLRRRRRALRRPALRHGTPSRP
jgi:hypothetical protein